MFDYAKPEHGQKAVRQEAKTRGISLPELPFNNFRAHYTADKPAQLQESAYARDNRGYAAYSQEKPLAHSREKSTVVQRFPFPAWSVGAYAWMKNQALPDGVSKKVSKLTDKDKFLSLPSKERIDPLLEDFAEKKAAVDDETYRQYVTNAMDMIENVRNHNFDLSPKHVRNLQGHITPSDPALEVEQIQHDYRGMDIINDLSPANAGIFYKQIAVLKSYCLNDDVYKVIGGAAKNVKRTRLVFSHTSDDTAGVKERGENIFINRLRLMTEYIKSVGDAPFQDSTIADFYNIESTGSDPHENGSHALFLISKTGGEKRVYKPHSLQFENALLGAGGLMAQINAMPGGNALPTMEFNPGQHTESFVERVGDYENPLGREQVVEQYSKLGKLEAVMGVFGVTDLHGENVIFTNDGPIPIDAECGGFYGETGITAGNAPGEISEANYFTNASALYMTINHQQKQQALKGAFQAPLDDGILSMKEKLVRNRTGVLNAYEAALGQVDSFRVLPIDTTSLSMDLELYIRGSKSLQELSESALAEASNALKSESMAYYQPNMNLQMLQDEFIAAYSAALRSGTLPAFTFIMNGANAGAIKLDSTIIARVQYRDIGQAPGAVPAFHNASAAELIQSFVGKAGAKIDLYTDDLIRYTDDLIRNALPGNPYNDDNDD